MSYYSIDEIIEDVFNFEKVKIQISRPEDLPPICFMKLYSDVFLKPVDGNKTVDDLQARINQFFHRYGCPLLEREVDEDYEFTVYGCSDVKKPYQLIKAYRTEEDFRNNSVQEILSDIEIKTKFSTIIVITNELEIMSCLELNKH